MHAPYRRTNTTWLCLSAAKTDATSFTVLLKLKDCEVDYINPSPLQSFSLAMPTVTGIITAWRYLFQPFYTLQLSYWYCISWLLPHYVSDIIHCIIYCCSVCCHIYFTYHSYNPLLLFVFIALSHCNRMCYNLLNNAFLQSNIYRYPLRLARVSTDF